MRMELHASFDSGLEYEASPIDEMDYAIEASPETADKIIFFVAGEPVPQGSTKGFYIEKINRVVITHGNANTTRWRERIATEAQRADASRKARFFDLDREAAYEVRVNFLFTRPKSMPKKRTLHTKRPDLDKLVRAVLDGITDVLIPDDSQVMSIAARKHYCLADEQPGLHIGVYRIEK
ncbi:MAG: RusA family crossover junction endodeoxyribonuclease [Methanomassiliicoccales archaeon]